MKDLGEFLDINKTKGLPRTYKFNQFIRWFTLIFAALAIAYSIWLIFNKVDSDSSKFAQFVPFAIMFLALNSFLKNLFSLNKIKLTQEMISFKYLAKKNINIKWESLTKMELNDDKRRMIRLKYIEDDKEKSLEYTLSFPKPLEIANSIAEMAPQIEFDEFMAAVVITDKEKKDFLEKNKNLSFLLYGLSLSLKQIGIFLFPIYIIWTLKNSSNQKVKSFLFSIILISSFPNSYNSISLRIPHIRYFNNCLVKASSKSFSVFLLNKGKPINLYSLLSAFSKVPLPYLSVICCKNSSFHPSLLSLNPPSLSANCPPFGSIKI